MDELPVGPADEGDPYFPKLSDAYRGPAKQLVLDVEEASRPKGEKPMRTSSYPGLALCAGLLLAGARTTHAHNGAIALAYPVVGISLDGDLADWPADWTTYPIALAEHGDAPDGPEDLSALFRVGYDSTNNSLYIAVEVTDQSTVIADPDSGSWDNQDGCEIFVDSAHPVSGSRLVQYTRRGDQDEVVGQTDDEHQVAMQRTDSGQVYEWRIGVDRTLQSGQSLGLDVSVADMDGDGSFSWLAWGSGTQKMPNSDRVGDVLLAEPGAPISRLRGHTVWHDRSTTPLPRHVRVQSAVTAPLWTRVAVDSTGAYCASLPVGPYTVQAADAWDRRVDPGPHVHVHVVEDEPARADLLRVVPLPEPALIGSKGVLHAPDSLDPDDIDRFIHAYMEYYTIPGMSLALIKDGEVAYHRGYGLQDATGDERVEDTTLFEAASMTKPVFTYAVARLVERGVLDWDTPLHTYLPYEDIAHDERYKLITARLVVSHRTGFPNWRSGKLEILFTPGTEYGYSGEGFEYLGKVVAHLTGKTLVEVVQDEVLTPLGMINAYLIWDEESGAPKARPHLNGDAPLPRRQWDEPRMAASLHVDAGAYARFLIATSRGVGLSQATIEEMLRPQTRVPDSERWFGLGFSLEESPFGPRFGHGGSNYGFTSDSGYYRDLGMGYVVMVNNQHASQVDKALRAYLITGKVHPDTGRAH